MPKQDWSINTGEAYEGEMYGLAATNSQRFTYLVEGSMTRYGMGVQVGTSYNHIKLGAKSGKVLGITLRENKQESATRPGDGTVLLKEGTPLAVMLEGGVVVKLDTAITGEDIGCSDSGTFGAVDATHIKCVNVKALKYPAAAGDVIPVLVSMSPFDAASAPAVKTPA